MLLTACTRILFLGVETLKSWSPSVDFQQNCLRINGGKRSLVCDTSTAIPPNSEKIVVARIRGDVFTGRHHRHIQAIGATSLRTVVSSQRYGQHSRRKNLSASN